MVMLNTPWLRWAPLLLAFCASMNVSRAQSNVLFYQDFESTVNLPTGASVLPILWMSPSGTTTSMYRRNMPSGLWNGPTGTTSSNWYIGSGVTGFIFSQEYLGQDTASITFGPVNTSAYSNLAFSFNLASLACFSCASGFGGGSSAQGVDGSDYVEVWVKDGSNASVKQFRLGGYNNAMWDFSNTNSASFPYTSTAGGNTNLNTLGHPSGIRNVFLTNLPSSSNLVIEIRFRADEAKYRESWLIDGVAISSTRYLEVQNLTTNALDTVPWPSAAGGATGALDVCPGESYNIRCLGCNNATLDWYTTGTVNVTGGTNLGASLGGATSSSPVAMSTAAATKDAATALNVSLPGSASAYSININDGADALSLTVSTLIKPVAAITVGGNPLVHNFYLCPSGTQSLQGGNNSAATTGTLTHRWLDNAGVQLAATASYALPTGASYSVYEASLNYGSVFKTCVDTQSINVSRLQAPSVAVSVSPTVAGNRCPTVQDVLTMSCATCSSFTHPDGGTMTPTYTWAVGGSPITGATGLTYLPPTTANLSSVTTLSYLATYSIRYASSPLLGNVDRVCVGTQTQNLVYDPTPVITLSANSTGSNLEDTCANSTLNLNVTPSTGFNSYTWAVGVNGTTTTTTALGTGSSISHVLTATGTYKVTATTAAGCAATDTLRRQMIATPILTIDRLAVNKCFGDTLCYTVQCTNCSSAHGLYAEMIRTNPSTAGIWDSITIAAGNSPFTLCPAPSSGGGFSTSIGNIREYDITANYRGCLSAVYSTDVNISEPTNPSLTQDVSGPNPPLPDSLCAGTIVPMRIERDSSAGMTPVYQWNTGETTRRDTATIVAGLNIYAATVTNGFCVQTTIDTIVGKAVPTINVPSIGLRCTGADVPLSANSSGANLEYRWDTLSTPSPHYVYGSSVTIQALTQPRNVYLRVTDTLTGCVFRDTLPLDTLFCGSLVSQRYRYEIGLKTLLSNNFACIGDTMVFELSGLPSPRVISWASSWGPGAAASDTLDSLVMYLNPNLSVPLPDTIIVQASVTVSEVPRCEWVTAAEQIREQYVLCSPIPRYTCTTIPPTCILCPSLSFCDYFYEVEKVNTITQQISDTIIIASPTLSFVGDSIICQGDTAHIEASCLTCSGVNVAYTWDVAHLSANNQGTVPSSVPAGVAMREVAPYLNDTIFGDSTVYYYLEAQDVDAGCYSRDTVGVTIKPLPGLAITQGDTAKYCSSSAVTLYTSTFVCNNCTYEWNTGQQVGAITVNTTGEYYVTVVERGCSEVDSVYVEPFPATPIYLVNRGDTIPTTRRNVTLCVGQTEILSVEDSTCVGCNINWNVGATTRSINVSNQGVFYVNAVDTNGCLVTSSPVLAINAYTGYNSVATASATRVCQGDSVELAVAPCVNCNYTWLRSPVDTIVLDSSRFYWTHTSGNFYAEIENEQGCRYSSNIVSVGSAVTINTPSITSNTTRICPGSEAVLRTTAVVGAHYQWFLEGLPLSYATLDSLVARDTGTYSVRVQYSNGCEAASAGFRLQETFFEPHLLPNTSQIICGGNAVVLSVDSFLPTWSFQWYRNGVLIPGATGGNYSATQAGSYYAMVTNQYLCTQETDTVVRVTTSSVSTPTAQIFPPQICSGNTATLNVSLCTACEYEWFNASTGLPVSGGTPSFTSSKFTQVISNAGTYYAVVRSGVCDIRSNNVTLSVNTPVTPAINASSPFICNGVSATLSTPACTNCNYTWLRSGQPIASALNAPTFVAADTGTYKVRVLYPSGCASESAPYVIQSGYFSLNLVAGDSAICNAQGDTLVASVSPTCASGACVYEWYLDDVLQSSTTSNVFIANQEGIYKTRVTRSGGCYEESGRIFVEQINLNPTLSSTSSDICGTQPVRLSVSACPTCTYTWRRNSTPLTGFAPTSQTNYMTTVVGTYNVIVSQPKCAALSSSIVLNAVPALQIPIQYSDSVICASDTVILSRTLGSCSGCVFQWLQNGNPIPAATVASYSTTQAGTYRLQMRTLSNNCVDTSAPLSISRVNPPANFDLDLSAVSPLTSSSSPVSLDQGVIPASLAGLGNFSSVPFSGAATANQGLTGSRLDTFTAAVAGAGYHRIVYTYDSLGCGFEAMDVVQVLEPVAIQIINQNPSSVSYEACPSDSLRILVANLAHPLNQVLVMNQAGSYQAVSIGTQNITMSVYSGDTVFSGYVTIVTPSFAKSGYIQLRASTGDSTLTPFVLVHNEDLQLSGIPELLCSNGSRIPITATPSGGSFSLRDPLTNVAIATAFSGDTLNPRAVPTSRYNSQGQYDVRIVYQYPGFYTNGAACPQPDTVTHLVQIRAVFLDSVRFNPISESQTSEQLTNLVRRVYPHSASPTRWQSVAGRRVAFAGSFTSPAGDPLYFLPRNAGTGTYAITYSIKDSICSATVHDSIRVLPNPAPIGIQSIMCWNNPPVNFTRETATFPYQANPPVPIQSGISFRDTFNIIRVTSSNGNARTFTVNASPSLESYRFTTSASTINQVVLPGYPAGRDTFYLDTVTVEYIYRRVEYTGTPIPSTPFDTVEYVIASIRTPIMIEDTFSVAIPRDYIQDVYCEENRVILLSGLPQGGNFFLRGGTGAYATEQPLVNGLFNPYAVHSNENVDKTYRLRYAVSGLACQNQDTLNVLIPEPANPAFTTASGDSIYCAGEMPDTVLVSLQARDVSTWMIGGVAQPAAPYFVNPQLLPPGLHIGTHLIQNYFVSGADTIVCTVSASDTFLINALPNPQFLNASSLGSPAFAPEYCTNDSTVYFIVNPTPSCQIPPGSGITLVSEGFESAAQFPPLNWDIYNISGNNWTRSTSFPYGGTGCAFVDSSSAQENSWLIAPSVNMTAGRVYRIEYYVRTSAPFPNCAGCDNAALRVTIGNAATPAAQTTTLAYYANLTNTMYELRSQDYLCTSSGTYHFGFQAESGPNRSRWLRLDNIRIADISNVGCASGGLGTVLGAATSIVQDSLYTFSPSQITGGTTTTINYRYTDSNGCTDSVVQSILVKPHPAVSFNTINDYCANAPAIPVTASPIGGTFASAWLSGSGSFNFDTLSRSVLPRNAGTERLSYAYTDPTTNCTSIWNDTFTIFPILDTAAFVGVYDGMTAAYCASDRTPVALQVAGVAPRPVPPTGIFYGPGVRNGSQGVNGATFHPDSAVLDAHRSGLMRLTYVYATSNGCVDSSIFYTRVQSAPVLRFENLPDSICANAPNVQIRVRNRMSVGWYGETLVDSLIPVGAPNTLFTANGTSPLGNLTPSPALVGFHNMTYAYADSFCTASISDSFRVDSVPVVRFQNLPSTRFLCENDQPILLLATPPYFPGSGYLNIRDANGLVDSVQRSYFRFDPAVLATPANGNRLLHIVYEARDTRGCVGRGQDSLEIRPYPRIAFSMPNAGQFCQDDSLQINLRPFVSPQGGRGIGRGFFSDDLPVSAIFQDTLLQLNQVGPRILTYTYYDSLTFCSNDTSTAINVFNTPEFAFDILGGCAVDSLNFVITANNLDPAVDSITSIFWDFGDGLTLNPLAPNNYTIPDAYHSYSGNGTFVASLAVNNRGLCVDTVRQTFIVSPSITYNPNQPYVQTFDNASTGWYAEQPNLPANGATSIWSMSNLNGNHINDPANTAWVTHAQAPYTYQANQRAWVYSPCFDMRNAWRPMITFDLWRDMSTNIDGGVLEYYDYTDHQWHPFGRIYRGIHWYQTDFLLARPGNQPDSSVVLPQGWTGTSQSWEKARYRLDQFAGERFVRFRFAFASDSNTILQGFEGMAFDSVWIGERGRNALVEHFANLSYPDMDRVDFGLYSLIYSNNFGRDVNLIQYQTVLQAAGVNQYLDSIYDSNPADPSARDIYYGISNYAQAVVDGTPRGSGSTEDLQVTDLEYDMLQYPALDIQIAPININNGTLNLDFQINTILPLDSSEYAVFAAITEDTIYLQRDPVTGVHKHAVLRKMLPNPDGDILNQAWTIGSSLNRSYSWQNMLATVNPMRLQAVVFVQHVASKEVIQSATTRDLSVFPPVSVNPVQAESVQALVDLKLYPNPAQDYFKVEFASALPSDCQWKLIDALGRTVQTGQATSGSEQLQVQTPDLSAGMYFFVIYNDQVYTQRQVVIKRP